MTRWLTIFLGAGSLAVAAESDHFEWKRTDVSLGLLRGDQVVWQFNYGAEHPKSCFHPVSLPGSPAMTWFRPDDHPWHRGLWFSWKYINGVNYWEEDRASGQSEGRTDTIRTSIEPNPDFSAKIRQEVQYRPGEAAPVLLEQRLIEMGAPSEDGSYRIDWSSTFTAETELVLDRTPLPHEPGGQVFGGYAGLSVRFARELEERQVFSTQGEASFVDERFRTRSSALDYSGTLNGRTVGIAILDSPRNLNAPSPWYAINDPLMHYFSPAVLCYGPHHMQPGEHFTLRYRVVIHPGRWDAERLRREVSRWEP